jgi:hypothetical protein
VPCLEKGGTLHNIGRNENVQHTLKQILGDHAVARTDSRSMIMCTLGGAREAAACVVELQALREAQKEKRMEIEWCSSDALTKSMVA